jgi:hypothetical protein
MKLCGPGSQFLHSCFWAGLIYSHDRSAILLQEIGGSIVGNEYLNRLEIRECWNQDWGRAVSFLAVHKSDFLCSAADNSSPDWAHRRSWARRGPEAEFLDESLVIHSHLYSFALRFLFLQTHATSYSFCKGEKGGKTDGKPTSSSLWFKKSVQKPQVWDFSRVCPETSMNLYVHEFGFRSRGIWSSSNNPLKSRPPVESREFKSQPWCQSEEKRM